MSSQGDKNFLKLMVIVAQLCEYTKSHWVAHFKRISYMDFNLNMKEAASKNN